MTGYLYAIRAEGSSRVKLGYSARPADRLAGFQIGSPVPLRLVAQAQAPRRLEYELHRMLRERRAHGEWFDLDETLDALLCDIFAAIDMFTQATTREERIQIVALVDELYETAAA